MIDFDPLRVIGRERDPYEIYRQLRDDAPVYYSESAKMFVVSRYDDVVEVLRNDEVFSSRAMFTVIMNSGHEKPPFGWPLLKLAAKLVWQARMSPFGFATARHLIATDGETHGEMRATVSRGFTPRRIQSWEARIDEISRECTAALRAGEPFDVVRDLAVPLPVTMIAELLGVDPERRADFKRWSTAIIETSGGPRRSEPLNDDVQEAIVGLSAYIRAVADARRSEPRDDLISTIVAHEAGEVGFSNREVVQFVILLLVAGNETTTNLIGNAVTSLLAHPRELAFAAADPSLVDKVVEETLRYDSPVQFVARNALRDTEIAGTRIPAGAIVAPMIGSANRDERRFPEPDRFDISRESQGHVGFGYGRHFCLGASLARLEAQAALREVVPLLPQLSCDDPKPPLVDSFLVRGPRELHLRPSAG